jgi:hypothetical protein
MMITPESVAEAVLAQACGADFDGLAIVYSSTPIFARVPNPRNKRQMKEQLRLMDVVNDVERELRATLDPATAARLAESEGFGDCVRITTTRNELLAALSERFRSGDNAYDAPDVKDGLFRIGFWYDKSHRRFFE